VLDGRSVNGRFWVFLGGLSSVVYAVEITDTETLITRRYESPEGELTSAADTDAFS